MRQPSRHRGPLARRMLVVAVAAASLALTACGGGSDEDAAASDPDAAASATGAPAAAPSTEPSVAGTARSTPSSVPAALEFTATTVGGREFDGASLAGRPVVLWFWAPWCTVCARQAPQVADLAKKYGDRVAFVGVGSLDQAPALRRFAGRVPGPVHLSDVDGALYKGFRVSEQSSFVVLGADGREVLRTGYDDDAALASTIASLAG